MRILIYGEGYCFGIPLPLKSAMEKLGHKADIFDWTQWLYRTKRYGLKNRILDRILFHKVAKKINHNFLDTVKKNQYDFVIIIQGRYLFSSTISVIKSYTNLVVNWNPDDFFNPLNSSRYLLQSFDKYDCIFTSRGHLIEEYYKKGAKQVETLNWYYLPRFLHPLEISSQEKKKYGSDLVFIGTWSKRRENILSSLGDFNLRIWGGQWHKARRKFHKKIEYNNPVYIDEMCKVISSSKININLLTKENRDTTNIRNFEIPACGGFQLSERANEILELFEEDKEIVCFETVDELISKCKYYLKHDSERERIRLNGYRRLITGNHTLLDRAEQILRTIFN